MLASGLLNYTHARDAKGGGKYSTRATVREGNKKIWSTSYHPHLYMLDRPLPPFPFSSFPQIWPGVVRVCVVHTSSWPPSPLTLSLHFVTAWHPGHRGLCSPKFELNKIKGKEEQKKWKKKKKQTENSIQHPKKRDALPCMYIYFGTCIPDLLQSVFHDLVPVFYAKRRFCSKGQVIKS